MNKFEVLRKRLDSYVAEKGVDVVFSELQQLMLERKLFSGPMLAEFRSEFGANFETPEIKLGKRLCYQAVSADQIDNSIGVSDLEYETFSIPSVAEEVVSANDDCYSCRGLIA